jgi:nitroreductase
MEFFDVVNKRVSVREYSDKPVKREDIERIIDAGAKAATARNVQPWRFVVISKKEQIQELARIVSPNGAFMSGAGAAIVVLAEDTKYYLEDCCAATQNILLAAAALNIGSCWIAGDKKDYADKAAAFVKAFKNERLVSIISLGYCLKPITLASKLPLTDLVRWL